MTENCLLQGHLTLKCTCKALLHVVLDELLIACVLR